MDLPLHAQVAMSLGWTGLDEIGGLWRGTNPEGKRSEIPRYDISWCAMGPILNRYKLSVAYDQIAETWVSKDLFHSIGVGDSPTSAASRLVVRLYKEGRLNAA